MVRLAHNETGVLSFHLCSNNNIVVLEASAISPEDSMAQWHFVEILVYKVKMIWSMLIVNSVKSSGMLMGPYTIITLCFLPLSKMSSLLWTPTDICDLQIISNCLWHLFLTI